MAELESHDMGLTVGREREYIVKYTGDALQLLPDVMQELVRCKDCKHRTIINDALYCDKSNEFWMRYKKPDWFCADGEKDI